MTTTPGEEGKWFAAAKDSGLFEIIDAGSPGGFVAKSSEKCSNDDEEPMRAATIRPCDEGRCRGDIGIGDPSAAATEIDAARGRLDTAPAAAPWEECAMVACAVRHAYPWEAAGSAGTVRDAPSGGRREAASAPRLLDRVRSAIRTRHYSRRTERAYVGWIRRFILFYDKRAILSRWADPR